MKAKRLRRLYLVADESMEWMEDVSYRGMN